MFFQHNWLSPKVLQVKLTEDNEEDALFLYGDLIPLAERRYGDGKTAGML